MAQQVFCRATVSAGWLSGALKTRPPGPALRVLDSSWYGPGGKDARKEFAERHIEGASFFDLDRCSDRSSPYEMMLPGEAQFAKYVSGLGINNESHVVVYDCDSSGMLYAPRVWWMFRLFGHNKVSVLDGGLKNWLRQGLPVTSQATDVKPEEFRSRFNPSLLKTFEDVQENLAIRGFQLVDARSEGRFRGPEPKPGEGIEPGHIPGSVNLPFSSFLTADGYEKSPAEIRQLFQEKGIDLTKPLTATCRRGVTACHLALASFLLGKEDTAVYDGSWSEWFHRAKPEHKAFETSRSKA
ncbi:thiosulfate sulfurtransferase-like [Spea bombifrons]|uniref:thiosulfate sulfurtransferase-like n=1 Tax=Spea bombifrons TaxID=233779 RepID=UPI00234A0D3D|nr:thiosulfate sulfurtransferase-like [Spea bombifrons]